MISHFSLTLSIHLDVSIYLAYSPIYINDCIETEQKGRKNAHLYIRTKVDSRVQKKYFRL